MNHLIIIELSSLYCSGIVELVAPIPGSARDAAALSPAGQTKETRDDCTRDKHSR